MLDFSPPIIAHRGASGTTPENTMIAFKRAVEIGARWLEFDVVLAACGTAIIFHDEELDRTTTTKGPLSACTFAELHELDAGSWFHPEFSTARIPLFVDVLNFIKAANIGANIELKPLPGQEKLLVAEVLKIMQSFQFSNQNQILFSSFSLETLIYLRELSPTANIGILLHAWRDDWQDWVERLGCLSVHVYEQILDEERAYLIKHLNKYLLSYTVNNPDRARLLYSYGVDAIFTDFPERMLEATPWEDQ